LTPVCACLVEPRESEIELLKSTFNADNFICRLFWFIYSRFVSIHCWNVRCSQKLQKKSTKPPYWGVQGRSKSSILTNLKSTSLLLVTICCLLRYAVPICYRFYTVRAISGKITSFLEVPLIFDVIVSGEPPHPGARNFVTKTRVLVA